jgi:GNAT superfamily N-acetyltransferase
MPDAAILSIRPMRSEDAAAVATLTTELGYPAAEDAIRHRIDLIKDRPDARLFVAAQGDSVVGWLHVQSICSLENDPRAEIWGLVVGEGARGAGVGRRLIETAEEWAVRRGLRVMSLRSNQLRTGAHGFYEHLGYRVTKTQSAFRKILT